MSMDRNQKAKMDFARAQARRQFQQAFAAGQAQALDRFAAPIKEHDLVLYRPPFDLVFEVVKAGPSLDPSTPPGVVELELTLKVPVSIMANQPYTAMVKVGRVDPTLAAGGELVTPGAQVPQGVEIAEMPSSEMPTPETGDADAEAAAALGSIHAEAADTPASEESS